jgi:small subunit ribosomal protein S16
MKKLGRKHRPFFRICAMDSRKPRDGRVIEELGHYDPMVRDTDARVVLKRERVDYWLGVGAQPTPKVAVLIRKYGTDGTHVAQNTESLEKLEAQRKHHGPPEGFKPSVVKTPVEEEAPAEEAATEEVASPDAAAESAEAPAEAEAPAAETAESPASEEQPEETKTEE